MFLPALFAVSLAAPVPKWNPVYFFPTTVGSKMVWGTEGKDDRVASEVTKVEEKDGTLTVTVEYPGLGKDAIVMYVVTDKKLRYVGEKKVENYTMIDLGVKVGESWTREVEIDGRKRVTTFTLGKEVEVEVPAGKFKAMPVVERDEQNFDQWTHWYASGVGMVKSSFEQRQKVGREWVVVLKEFTPGTAAKK